MFPPPPGGQFPPQQGGPSAPPPLTVPQRPRHHHELYRVDPGAISGCMNRYTYIWLKNGHSFWFYPVYVGRSSIAGFRWQGNHWMYYGIDLDRIDSFTCYY